MVFNNKEKEIWKPTKFIFKKEVLVPSPQISIKSKRMASYISQFYSIFIPKYVKGKLLDLGCGHAPLFELYSKYATEITRADWQNSIHNQSNVDVFCDLNEVLIFGSNSFDSIILSDVINHLSEPEIALNEIYRILKPGGILLLNAPFLYNLNEEPFDFGRYSIHKYRFWAEKLKFKIIHVEQFGGINDVIEHFGLRILSLLSLGRLICRIIYSIRTFFVKHKFLKVNNTNCPYGYGVIMIK